MIIVVLGVGWVAVAVSAGDQLAPLSLIDLVVLLGVGVVLPLAIGGRAWWWVVAGGATVVSLLLPKGWSGLLIVPLALAVASIFIARLRPTWSPGAWSLGSAAEVLAPAYALVGVGALVASRAGIKLFGIGEPIVELTAVHYFYAGTAALVLAKAALEPVWGRRRHVARAAVVLTAVAPPVVAVGFVTGSAFAQVGGAMVMTLGVWLTAGLQLRASARADQPVLARVLLGISGLAVWVPMVLAVAWAAGQHWDVPALSIPDMVRTHGLANAIAFALGGLLGRRCAVAASDHHAPAVPA